VIKTLRFIAKAHNMTIIYFVSCVALKFLRFSHEMPDIFTPSCQFQRNYLLDPTKKSESE
jgi:hypothetical protein